jgi:hypothetical protein
MSHHTQGKSKQELIDGMMQITPGSVVSEHYKMTILAMSVDELKASIKSLEDSMNSNAKSNDSLAKKVFWLNVVIAGATAVYAITTVVALCIRK